MQNYTRGPYSGQVREVAGGWEWFASAGARYDHGTEETEAEAMRECERAVEEWRAAEGVWHVAD